MGRSTRQRCLPDKLHKDQPTMTRQRQGTEGAGEQTQRTAPPRAQRPSAWPASAPAGLRRSGPGAWRGKGGAAGGDRGAPCGQQACSGGPPAQHTLHLKPSFPVQVRPPLYLQVYCGLGGALHPLELHKDAHRLLLRRRRAGHGGSPPGSATLSHSQPLSATLSHSQPLSATLSHSQPLSATLSHSQPLSATLSQPARHRFSARPGPSAHPAGDQSQPVRVALSAARPLRTSG